MPALLAPFAAATPALRALPWRAAACTLHALAGLLGLLALCALLALAAPFALPFAGAAHAGTPSLADEPPAALRPALSQHKLDRWQAEQGLPMNTVQALLQTRDGALWVGTGGGLVRFDGHRFTSPAGGAMPELATRSIFGLLEDRDGALWVGHTRGAVRWRGGRVDAAIGDELTAGRRVWSFAQAPDGSIWAASENGLVHWRADAARVYQEADGLPTRRLRALAFDRDGTLWIATTGGGLVALREGRFEVLDRRAGFPHPEVRALLADPAGGVWAATAGAGLVHVQGGHVQILDQRDGLPTDHLTALARGADGALWIGTWGAGVVRYADGRFDAIDSRAGLDGDQIWTLHADREGSLWVGTWHGGMNRLSSRPFAVFGRPEGLSGDNTRSVLHARDGAVWVAIAGGGVNRLAGGEITHYGRAQGLATDEVSALMEDADGAIWIATYTEGVARLHQGRIESWGTGQGLPHADVRVLLRDRDGVLWAGTRAGLARLEGRRFVAVREPGAPSEGVTVIRQTRDGTLWFGTSGSGLARLRGGRFETLRREHGLLSNWILALHEDADGSLWIGTNGEGLNRLRGDRIASVRPADGLWDGLVQVILEDGQGRLWMSCNRGFFRVDRAQLDAFAEGRVPRVVSTAYGPGDALRSSTFAGGVHPAGAVDRRGQLWLPSVRGLVVVDPARLPDPVPPPARVLAVTVDGQVQPATGPVLVPRDAVSLAVEYGAATLLHAERVRFRYRIEGLTAGWVDAGRQREATFAALPPGEHRFELAASLDGRRWQAAAAPLVIEVQPRLLQTPWFVVLLMLALLGAVAGLHRLRTHQLHRRGAEMERLVAEKTAELQRANEHLQRLSFDDALTGLPNRRRLDEVLQTEWRRAARLAQPLAVVVADVDAFKAYNDHFGHLAADEVLVEVAAVIRHTAHRAGDFAARFGGEEFVVLIPGADAAAARAFAERLRAAVQARAIAHPASPVAPVLTVSLGVASRVPTPGDAAQSLFADADAALYRAKQDGRNRVR